MFKSLNTTKKQVIFTIAAFLCAFAALAGIKFSLISWSQGAHGQAVESVTSVITKVETWSRTLQAVGSLAASQGVVLAVEEPGTVSKILFESGESVSTGKLLVELDTSVEEAELRAAQALFTQAERDYNRAKQLFVSKANSQSDVDMAQAKFHTTKAAIESLAAKIARKKIAAPFDGRTGIRMVNIGQYLSPGSAVVPLYRLDPLYVNFSLPEQSLAGVSTGLNVSVETDTFPGKVFEANLSAIDPQVDPITRNINLQATLPNADQVLKPGMYARVSVVLPKSDQFIILPTSSLQYAPYGTSVYIIEKMKNELSGKDYLGVKQQIVQVGPKRVDSVAILSGLEVGQEVVSSGTFKLRPGVAVVVNNSIMPQENSNPPDA